MSDIVECPSCKRKLRIRPELQGHAVKCPSCNNTFQSEFVADDPVPDPVPARPSREEEDEEEYRERPRRARRDHDDEEDDDYDYDRPRRRRRRRRDYEPHRGVLILVLGIAAIMGFFAPVTSIVAWVLGSNDLREIREGRMDPEGESMTRIGQILGIVSTLLFAAVILFFCVIISIAIANG